MTEVYAPFIAAMKKFAEAQELMSRGPGDFYVKQMVGAYIYLMENFAPFKAGDKVVLVKLLSPFPSGWAHCKHFIKIGAKCEVRHIICDENGFIVEVMFDDESWVDSAGGINPVEEFNKHTFTFRSDSFCEDF